ncbi:MAG: sigma-70 family RNA polymerase sigma factor [Candidatus Cloacimonetes bacterium]|nr:sigma-70 family RNA polymerase sigma factor [Candidatus Cloacimonadota bacterium]
MRKQNKKIFNYLLKILRNREDAEDILQETFVAFYKKMETISQEAHVSYLYRTAHNRALNLIKKRKKRDKHSINYSEMEHLPAGEKEAEINNKNIEILKSAFSQLPQKYATILEMQFYQKMSYREIAKVLETTEKAVDSRLVRAKRKLKKIISQEMKRKKVFKSRGEKNEEERMQIFA